MAVMILVYDIEIYRAILNGTPAEEFEEHFPGVEYCRSFKHFDKMGIGCVCALSDKSPLPLIFDRHNVTEFQDAIDAAETVVSYNGDSFDSKVLATCGVNVPSYK